MISKAVDLSDEVISCRLCMAHLIQIVLDCYTAAVLCLLAAVSEGNVETSDDHYLYHIASGRFTLAGIEPW